MFIFGTNDFGKNRCNRKGCKCICEVEAAYDGTCDVKKHRGYRLYRYDTWGKYICQNISIAILSTFCLHQMSVVPNFNLKVAQTIILTLTLGQKMRGKNVGGIVEDRRVIVGGVASKECAADKVGSETDATETQEDQTTISARKHQEVKHF